MKTLKIALLGAAASLAMSSAAMAQDDPAVDVSFNLGVASDYVFRGVSQTDEGVQVFGGVDVTTGIFYAGAWASNVDFLDGTDAEVDLYAGVRPQVGPATLDLGVIYYGYVSQPDDADYDYWEFKAAASIPAGPATLGAAAYYSPDFTSFFTDEGLYLEVNGSVPLSDKATLSAAIGHQSIEIDSGFALLTGVDDVDYATWNVGVVYAITETVGIDLRYWDTGEDDFVGEIAEERVVLSLKATFP